MRTLFIALTTCLFVLPAHAKYSGGTGEPNDPYQIATAEDLMLLGDSPEDYDKHFILTADIDLDPNLPGRKVFDRAVIAADANEASWRFEGTSFTGVFHGNGHTIAHLTIRGGSYLGLFGQLGAEVRDLGIVDVNVAGSGNYVGGLVGWNAGDVAECHISGAVSGNSSVGGLVGVVGGNGGTVTQCYTTGAVSGNSSVGGLVGSNGGGIATSYSTSTAIGVENVGGLVGNNIQGVLTLCYSTGVVSGSGDYVGGLVGINVQAEGFPLPRRYGFVTACFWDIQTSGQVTSDGGTGKTTAAMQDINTFLNAGWDFVNEVLSGTCDYWQISPDDYPRLRWHAGDRPVMPEGLGTPEQPYLIRDAGDLGTVWFEPMAHYRLEASVDLSGINWSMAVIPRFGGTFDGNGYVISNLHIQGAGYLGLFGQLASTASVSNLDLEAVAVNGIGPCVGGLVGTNGSYNREGGVLTNCSSTGVVSSDGSSVGALLGRNNGTLTRCHSSGTVRRGYYGVGGLVGSNGGSIATSYSTGAISGGNGVGGLVGENSDGSITECYSNGAVSGTHYQASAGGLVGENSRGTVTQCYSAGAISGRGCVGGLMGYNSRGSVTQCYSTGLVSGTGQSLRYVGGLVGYAYDSSMIACFWDTQTSSQATSAGGIGKTTAEMQTAKTFLDAGWDFVGETKNGTEDIWRILEGKDYPRLWWETAGQ